MQGLRPPVRIPEITSRDDSPELSCMPEPEFGATVSRRDASPRAIATSLKVASRMRSMLSLQDNDGIEQ
jgi:hypothetical protein